MSNGCREDLLPPATLAWLKGLGPAPKPAPRRVRLMDMLVPIKGPNAAQDAFIAAFARAIRNGRNLRVVIEADAPECGMNAVYAEMSEQTKTVLGTECQDCRGTGRYQGLGAVEDCRTCRGAGRR